MKKENKNIQKRCHSRGSLPGISTALKKRGGDPRLQTSGMTAKNNSHAEKFLLSISTAFKQQSRDPEQKHLRMTKCVIRSGFTLIELLVVVLIIAILAAIALPQYQKAVWRNRNLQLKTLASSVGKAQELYYLANGHYATNLNELDLELPAWTSRKYMSGADEPCKFTTTSGSDAVRVTDDFFVGLTLGGSVFAGWYAAPYTCGGFLWNSSTKQLHCTERADAPFSAGRFCVRLEKASYDSMFKITWRLYNLN